MTVLSAGFGATFALAPGLLRGLATGSRSLLAGWLLPSILIGFLAFTAVRSAQLLLDEFNNDIRLSPPGNYDPFLDDFVVFYSAGDLAASGDAVGTFDPDLVHAHQAAVLDRAPSDIIALPFFNAPYTLAGLSLLSRLPLGTAAVAWSLGGIAAATIAAAVLFRERRTSLLVGGGAVVGIVSSMPFHETILHGQFSFLLLAAWVGIWAGEFSGRHDRWTVLGLVLLALKPQLILIPLLYLLVRRRFRPLLSFVAIEAGLFAGTLVMLGPATTLAWARLLLEAAMWSDEYGIWIHAMFGWNAFVRSLVGAELEVFRTALMLLLIGLTLGFVCWAIRSRARARTKPELFAVLVFASLLLSPHLYAQDLVIAAAPLLLLAVASTGRAQAIWIAYGLLGWALMAIHFDVLLGAPHEFGVNTVSLWLAGGVVLGSLGVASFLGPERGALPPKNADQRRSTVQRPASSTLFQLGGPVIVAFGLLALAGSSETAAETLVLEQNGGYPYGTTMPGISKSNQP